MLGFCKFGSFAPINTNLSQELNNKLLLKPMGVVKCLALL